MAYLRCESCGAKALVAASRCPRCAHEFRLVDGRGDRLALAQCRGCGIMHARGASCHWCPAGTRSTTSTRIAEVAKAAAVLCVIGASGAAAWTYRSPLHSAVAATVASTKAALAREPRGAPIVVASMSGGQSTTTPIVPRPAEAPVVMLAADGPGEASADTVHWVPAVARTWVNVRNEAGRGADVVGVIKPASRAMLGGTGRAGWRQVRSDSATGWVDPKLFDADSARTRG